MRNLGSLGYFTNILFFSLCLSSHFLLMIFPSVWRIGHSNILFLSLTTSWFHGKNEWPILRVNLKFLVGGRGHFSIWSKRTLCSLETSGFQCCTVKLWKASVSRCCIKNTIVVTKLSHLLQFRFRQYINRYFYLIYLSLLSVSVGL